jgi:NADH:ubiquinone oxidoreductase subunit 4 (subunit M)
MAAAYNLRAVRGVAHGAGGEWPGISDLSAREILVAGLLAVSILALGLWPALVLEMTGDAAAAFVAIVGGGV